MFRFLLRPVCWVKRKHAHYIIERWDESGVPLGLLVCSRCGKPGPDEMQQLRRLNNPSGGKS